MKELTAKAAQIGQAAALKKANDPTLSDRAAKMAATLDAGYRDSWLDNNDDLVQGGYQKAMTTIRIQSWPGNKYWGWFFTWPWGVLSWLLIIVLLFAAFAPRPSYGPISSLSSLNSNMAAISGSLARIRSEERRVGKGCSEPWRARWAPGDYQQQNANKTRSTASRQ